MSDNKSAITMKPALSAKDLKKMAIKVLASSSGEKYLFIDSGESCVFSNISINYLKVLNFLGLGHCGILITEYKDFRVKEREYTKSSKDFCFKVRSNENVWADMVYDLDKVRVVIV